MPFTNWCTTGSVERKDLFRCAAGVNPSFVQHQNALSDPPRAAHIVGDHDRRDFQAVANPHDELVDAVGNDRIQARSWVRRRAQFPARKQWPAPARPACACPRKARPASCLRCRAGPPSPERRPTRSAISLSRQLAFAPQGKGHIFRHSQRVEEGGALKDHAEPMPDTDQLPLVHAR